MEQLCSFYFLIVTSGYPRKYYTSVGGSMTTGLEGLLDIRKKKNDMLNALRFLVEYTGTALLSFYGPGRGIQ